jgi:uncharacterized protein (DUF1330 family)
METNMTAYIIVELTLRDAKALDRYREEVGPVLKQFGGELLAVSSWHVFHGAPAYDLGTIISFPDKDAALARYSSPSYQALHPVREKAFDSRFRLIG